MTVALLWVVGVAVCATGRICDCRGSKAACAPHASLPHEQLEGTPHEQGHSDDAGQHDAEGLHQHAASPQHEHGTAPQHCDGKQGCNDDGCCSSIQALIVTTVPIVIPKSISQPTTGLALPCAVPQHRLAAIPEEALRQAKQHEWVFTPEVRLGPAFHSLAPPAIA